MTIKATPPLCPYKGLQPYTEENSEYFFGRENDREVIASNLYIAPLTILYGTSGVGKSSVLQAGVIPQLKQRRRVTVVLFNSWQGETFESALKNQVLRAVAQSTGETEESVLRELARALNSKETINVETLSFDALLLGCARAFRHSILLIFDQFEEYFLYHSPTVEAEGFDAAFARAVNQHEPGVNFMLSMREEELSKLDRFRTRVPNLLSNLLRLEHLNHEAAVNAIREPLKVYNAKYPAQAMEIEDALVAEIIEQVRPEHFSERTGSLPQTAAPAADPHADVRIETPFLQLVLTRLWDAERLDGSHTLSLKKFVELGGARDIARRHLDDVMQRLDDSQRATAAAVLRFLVTPTGSKIAQQPAALAVWADLKESDVLPVLTLLSAGQDIRILRRISLPQQADRYELFHDVLGPAILAWRAAYMEVQGRIEAERRAEEQRRRADEQARIARRLRSLVAAMVLMFLLATGAAAFAFSQSKVAEEQRNIAEEKTRAAIASEALANDERAKAVAASKRADEQKDIAIGASQRADVEKNKAVAASQRADKEAQLALVQLHRAEVATAEAVQQKASADTQRSLADTQRSIADQKSKESLSRELAANSTQQLPSNLELSVLLANEAVKVSPTEQAEDALRRGLLEARLHTELRGHNDKVKGAFFSPDSTHVVTISDDKTARVWDAETGNFVELSGHTSNLNDATFSPDGKYVLTTDDDLTTRIWEAAKGQSLLWNTATGQPLSRVLQGANSPPRAHKRTVHYYPLVLDGQYVLLPKPETTEVWEVSTRRKLFDIPEDNYIGSGEAALSPNGKYIVAKSKGNTARVWEIGKGRSAAVLQGHADEVRQVAFSHDGKTILTVGDDATARLWKLPEMNGSSEQVLQETMKAGVEGASITTAVLSPDGKLLVMALSQNVGVSNEVKMWDVAEGIYPRRSLQWKWDNISIKEISFSPDSNFVLVRGGGYNGETVVQDVGLEKALEFNAGIIAFSPDSRFLIVSDKDSESSAARVYELGTGKIIALLRGHAGFVEDASFSPDGKHILTASDDKTARVWDISVGQMYAEVQARINNAFAPFYSPDGRSIYEVSSDDTFRVLDAETGSPTFERRGPDLLVRSAAVSPDTATLAVTASPDSAARVWQATTGQQLDTLRGHKGHVHSIAFSADGRLVVLGGADGTASVWDVETGKMLRKLEDTRSGSTINISSVAFSQDGKFVAAIFKGGLTDVWEVGTGKLTARLPSGGADQVAISPDGRFVVTNDTSQSMLWDVSTAGVEQKAVPEGVSLVDSDSTFHNRPLQNAMFSPDGKYVLTAGGQFAHVWDLNTGKVVFVCKGHAKSLSKAAFSPDGKRVVTASVDGTARIWNLPEAGVERQIIEQSTKLTGHEGPVTDASFSRDGKLVVTTGADKTARVWDAASGRQLKKLSGATGALWGATFSPDSKFVVTEGGSPSGTGNNFVRNYVKGDMDETARVWDVDKERNLVVLRAHIAAFSPDGKFLITETGDDTAWLWNTRTGQTLNELREHTGEITSMAFSLDGQLVATATTGGMAKIWGTATGHNLAVLSGHTGEIKSINFSRDGRFVIAAGLHTMHLGDKESDVYTARIWEARTGQSVAVLKGHGGDIKSAVFSDDGKLALTASSDKTARVWDVKTGNTTLTLSHREGAENVAFSSAAFSSDDRFIVTTDENGAEVWDAKTGQVVTGLFGQKDSLTSAAFRPDGRFIITSNEGATQLFACDVCVGIDELQRLVEKRINRSLKPEEKEKYLHIPDPASQEQKKSPRPPQTK